MQLNFATLELENYGSFIGKHKFKLDAGAGLGFVRGDNKVEPRLGSNGAGKSTLLNALCWCLYGKTTNGLLSTDVRPWSGKGQTSVRVTFEVDGKHKGIDRTAGPNSLDLLGSPVVQEDIDKLLGMSFEVFRQTIFLGQGRPLFHDLTNAEKLRFLADVLDLERWDRYSRRASDQVASLNRVLYEAEGSAATLKSMVAELQQQEELQNKEYKAWEAERLDKYKALSKTVKELAKRREELADRFAEVHSRWDMDSTNCKLLTSDIENARAKLRDLEREHHRKAARVEALELHRDDAQKELDDLLKAKVCPTCKRPMTDRKLLLENRKRVEGKIAEYMKEAHAVDLKASETAVVRTKDQLGKSQKERDALYDKVVKLEQERNHFRDERAEADTKLTYARKELDQWESDVNPHRARLVNLRKLVKTKRAAQEEREGQIEELKHSIETTGYWVKAFKDVRLHVLDEVLRELEFVTNDMLDDIGLLGWEVRYDVERETKSGTTQRGLITTVYSPGNDKDVKWTAWSGGEGQRLRIVGALALSQVLLERAGVDCNIEVLDEPTRHLSSEGVDDLCEFLAKRADDLDRTIWMVDHKAMESTYFNQVVTVVKDEAGSSIRR